MEGRVAEAEAGISASFRDWECRYMPVMEISGSVNHLHG